MGSGGGRGVGKVGTQTLGFPGEAWSERLGARVVGTATGADGMALVRDLGADGVFDPRSDGAVEQLREPAPALERAVEEARLRVPIGGVYPLEQAAAAHARVERGHVLGRIVLRTGEEG